MGKDYFWHSRFYLTMDRQQKAMNHQSGTIHVSSHRLFFIDNQTNSFALDLSLVTKTEYYAGLFTSSSKVTLHLDAETPPSAEDEESWVCHVCGQRNHRGSNISLSRVCGLCGVQRPPSKPSTPLLETNGIVCPACTFLNDRARSSCEICTTQLPVRLAPEASLIKLSFRKGGDKALYSVLKSCLKTKAWEVRPDRDDINVSLRCLRRRCQPMTHYHLVPVLLESSKLSKARIRAWNRI